MQARIKKSATTLSKESPLQSKKCLSNYFYTVLANRFILCVIIDINQDDDFKNPLPFFTPENFSQKYSEPFLNTSQKTKHWTLKQE